VSIRPSVYVSVNSRTHCMLTCPHPLSM